MRIQGRQGQIADVDDSGRLFTLSTSLNVDQSLLTTGRVSSMVMENVTPTVANNYIFYLRNIGTLNVAIGHATFMASAATTLWFDYVSGEPAYLVGTPVEVTNRRLGNPTKPAIDAQYDANITGLTQEGKLFFQRLDTANQSYFFDTVSGITIPTGQALAIRSSNILAAVTMVCSIGIVLL